MTPNPVVFRHWTIASMASGSAADTARGPLGLIDDGALVVRDGRVEWIGPDAALPERVRQFPTVVGDGQLLTPGLIDCHTHLVYAGDRIDDWRERLAGVSYAAIAQRGGGILSTVRATRAATEDELFALALPRLQCCLAQGVTTLEIKTGYGLTTADELKMLKVIARLQGASPMELAPTLLAAHATPPELAGRPGEYLDEVIRDLLPQARDRCEAIDAFCESIAFDLAQTERVFRAAAHLGLGIKVHAEQLSLLGGARLAARYRAWSADHLEFLDEPGAQALAEAGTVATLLPGAYYFLRERQKPPVTTLRALGVPMAVATDFNPGSSPLGSLLLAANMAVTLFELTPEEALLGITRHAARALRREDRLGSLAVGKQADLVAWSCASPYELIYPIGHYPQASVFKAGQQVSIDSNPVRWGQSPVEPFRQK